MTNAAPASPNPAAGHRPIDSQQRLDVLDVLRGFALLGILVANVLMFSGLFFKDMAGLSSPGTLDQVVYFAQEVLVHGKFYSIFSLLFGIGFFIFLSRAERRGMPAGRLFARRLAILLGIGIVHATLLWAGDILTLYALLGYVLLLFYRCTPRALLAWVVALLASRILIYALMWWSGMQHPLAPPADAADESFDAIGAMISGFQGGYGDVLGANALQLYGRWVSLLVSVRVPTVLALFLLGLWIGRRGIAADLSGNRPLLRRAAAWGLGLGLPLNALWIWLMNDAAPYLPGSLSGMFELAVESVGVPLLAIGYAAGVALMMQSARVRGWLNLLAPVGRMALTNYLLQSVACMFIFYGLGLGLYGQLGTAAAVGVVLPVYALQVLASRWWLSRFRFGPVEWLWRRLTYGVPVRFRRPGTRPDN